MSLGSPRDIKKVPSFDAAERIVSPETVAVKPYYGEL